MNTPFCKRNLVDFFFLCTNVRFTFVIYLGLSQSSIPHFAFTDICGLIPLSCMNGNDHFSCLNAKESTYKLFL